LLGLVVATIGLYGGGVVFNDVFDAKLDAIERPERPIPKGIVSKMEASVFGGFLLVGGIIAAWFVSPFSGGIAIVVAFLALLYDSISKHYTVLGPLNMGLCRAGNLLLGISAVQAAVFQYWFIAIIPIVYIGAITLISQGEVHGGNRKNIFIGMALYGIVLMAILCLPFFVPMFNILYTLPFLFLFSYLVFKPLIEAIGTNAQPKSVMLAVKAGVIAVIVLDASIAAGLAGILYGSAMLVLFPISRFIAKQFSVT